MGKANGLRALELAQLIAKDIKEIIDRFPPNAPLGLRAQLSDAVNSVHSNIAEGYGRATPRERQNKLRVARGELEEAQSQLKVASLVNCIAEADFYRAWNRMRVLYRMLVKLARRP